MDGQRTGAGGGAFAFRVLGSFHPAGRRATPDLPHSMAYAQGDAFAEERCPYRNHCGITWLSVRSSVPQSFQARDRHSPGAVSKAWIKTTTGEIRISTWRAASLCSLLDMKLYGSFCLVRKPLLPLGVRHACPTRERRIRSVGEADRQGR